MAKHTSETPENEIQNRFSSENVEGFGAVIYYILYVIGSQVMRESRRLCRKFYRGVRQCKWFIKRNVSCLWDKAAEKARSSYNRAWGYPLTHTKENLKEAAKRLSIAKNNGNYGYLIIGTWGEIFHALKPLGKPAVRVINCLLPLGAAAALVLTLNYYSGLTYALSVEYNGQHIGYIHSEAEFYEAEKAVLGRIVNEDYIPPEDYVPQFTMEVIDEDQFTTEDELTDSIIQASGNEIQLATGLYVDGKFVGATTDGESLVLELKEMLDETRREAGPNAKVSFVQPIKVQEALYPVASIVELSDISAELNKETATTEFYTIKPGDTPYDVANEYDISLDTLMRNNEDVVKTFLPGDSLLIESAVPMLEKKVVKTVTEQNKINYKTEQVQNNNYDKGYTKTKRMGVAGIEEIVSEVTYIDGFEVERIVVERNVIKEPVNAILEVGTLMPETYLNNVSGGSVGGFIWPVDGGYISCPIWGYYNHTGTDIACKAGTAIRASADGVVIASGYVRGYGYRVLIDHGNGIQTLYGHNSALYVSAGQQVQQGQLIAGAGRTGNATGNHCHFEVIINGQFKDARQYIGYSYPGR